jgi:hypothetical protein
MDPMQQQQMQQQPAVVAMPMAMPSRESYHPMAQYSQPQQQPQQQQQQQPPQQQPPSYVSSGYGAPPQQQAAPAMIMAPMPRLPGQTVPTSVTPAPPQGAAADGMASWYQQNLSQISAVANANPPAGGSSTKPIPIDFAGELKSVKDILTPEMVLLLQYIATYMGNTSLAKHGTTLTEIYIHHDLMGEDKAFRFQKMFYLYQEKYPIYKNEFMCGWLVAALGMAVFQGNSKMLDLGVKQTVIALGVDPMYATSHNTSTSMNGMSRAVATMIKDRMAARAKARADAALAKANATENATEGAGAEGTASAADVAEASTSSSTNSAKRSTIDDSDLTVSANKRPKTELLGEDEVPSAVVSAPVEKSTRQKVLEAITAIESNSSCPQIARDLADVAKLILKTDVRVPDQAIYEAALKRALDQHPMKRRPEFEQWDLALNVGSIIHKMSPALLALNYMTLSKQSLKRYGPDANTNTNLTACAVRFNRLIMAPVSLMGTGYQTIVMNNTGGLGSMIGNAMSLTGNPSVILGTPLKAVMTNLITEETQVRAPGEKLKNEAESTVVMAIIKSASAYARTDGSVDLRAYAEKTIYYNAEAIESQVEMGPHELYRRDKLNIDIHDWNIRCSEQSLPVADLIGSTKTDATTVRNYMTLIEDGTYAEYVKPIYQEYRDDAQKKLAESEAELEPEPKAARGGKSGRRYDDSAASSYKFAYGKKARN